ncbi:Sapep family Mn(2+)-dependent dipeptidase [Isachenkonia alkalipeptolytica]|uniref:Sapep family Mn(2+)-dependent dipeptidase n=1 Tax=Isachenkonia alkalipeptolytica TaxID=2565777 RepID=A0AA43XI30_9CLOT|nr:Sapep family Mn(2+)-dependent dipeptidase [Isachenkonia alkalipeptolytica]NBG87243.1 Sapep family Mn(2+)-dependent dipeptidase [Isachenkonia alkalipeptolytica]
MQTFDASKYKEPMIQDMISLVKIPSVIDESREGAPFGIKIQKALEKALEISKELGFRTFIDPEGYYGYGEIGEGEKLFGILGHLDVVPPGDPEQWETPAFQPEIREGKVYGRGTQDDKGPMIAAMYGAKQLLDQGHGFCKRLRFIFGTDEETLWRGIEKYMEKEEVPDFGFTPDSIFPMIHAEKGLLQLYLRGEGSKEIAFGGGNSFNALADRAWVELKKTSEGEYEFRLRSLEGVYEKLKKENHPVKMEENRLTLYGKSAHSAKPEGGLNAINLLAKHLKEAGINNPALNFVEGKLGLSQYGEKLFGKLEDVSGPITINAGQLTINEEKSEIALDLRIPVTIEKNRMEEKIKEGAKEYGLTLTEHDYLEAIYLPKDHLLIRSLGEVYQKVTGEDPTPLTSGGATYARAMPNCVAFGAVLPGREKTEHQPNEHIIVEDFMKVATIYLNAIEKLTSKEG